MLKLYNINVVKKIFNLQSSQLCGPQGCELFEITYKIEYESVQCLSYYPQQIARHRPYFRKISFLFR